MVEIKVLKGEAWYPCVVNDGYLFPLDDTSTYEINFSKNNTYNQINPLLLSSFGRYIYLDEGGLVKFCKGIIEIHAEKYELNEEGKTLKDAQQNALKRFTSTSFIPDESAFINPQLCTWIALEKEQTTENIMAFANGYLSKGFKPGVLIIDDGWHDYIGSFSFNLKKIPDPKKLVSDLHEKGFKVLLWLSPYVVIESDNYKLLKENNALIKINGQTNVIDFFDGNVAQIDFMSDFGKSFFVNQCKKLKEEYRVDGFKLDCGDEQYFNKDYPLANEQNRLYFDCVTEEVPNLLIEARCIYKHCCKNVIQRLSDKMHIYGIEDKYDDVNGNYIGYGLRTIVPDMQTLGLSGYAFGCADMVGGGNINCRSSIMDNELLIRWAQASSCFPSIQFSYPYWENKDLGVKKAMEEAVKVHEMISSYIIELANNSLKTNEPIVRYLEYTFPHQGLEKVTDEFMVGDKYLCSPILEKNQKKKTVIFPKGYLFRNVFTNEIFKEKSTFDVDINTILLFEKMEEAL